MSQVIHRGAKCRLAPPHDPNIDPDTKSNTAEDASNTAIVPSSTEIRPTTTVNSDPDAKRSLRRILQPGKQDPPVNYDLDDDEPPPPINPQFFYSSPMPIDDPLSPGTGPAAVDPSFKGALRPFSSSDSNALEKAWRQLTSLRDTNTHSKIYHLQSPDDDASKHHSDLLTHLVSKLAKKHFAKHGSKSEVTAVVLQPVSSTAPVAECCQGLWTDVDIELEARFCVLVRRQTYMLSRERVAQEVMNELRRLLLLKTTVNQGIDVPRSDSFASTPSTSHISRTSTSFVPESLRGVPRYLGEVRIASKETMADLEIRTKALANHYDKERGERSSQPGTPIGSAVGSLPAASRALLKPSPSTIAGSLPPASGIGSLVQQARLRGAIGGGSKRNSMLVSDGGTRPGSRDGQQDEDPISLGEDPMDSEYVRNREISVGLSQLHVVNVSTLVMKPIYWSPVNDISPVTRATWFYKDTMLPVPINVANQLEAGYRTLRAWSSTWRVELKCAIEIGAAGEEKISHPLWPQELTNPNAKLPTLDEPRITGELYCAAHCFYDQAAAEGKLPGVMVEQAISVEGQEDGASPTQRPYDDYHVMYKDDVDAFLLKPSQRPSGYYGRRPISRIMKGNTVGIPVCRGFDRVAWENLYERSLNPHKEESWAASDDASTSSRNDDVECSACAKQQEERRVTDLVLVAHGIGQKFAERVESFHFTYAINSFRRAVNIELREPAVKNILRPDHNGIMVLPLNWRHTLSFEDGGPKTDDHTSQDGDAFSLKDIEPPTIPAVRSLISDVMFDIPFYMSHHKSKMIEALVGEANRVYRLWCQNNPGFHEHGRVHLLGHSLGSAMAMDILSRQPSHVPKLDLSSRLSVKHFEFDVTNLILCGSPAAFFLLLERGTLLPRRGRGKPGAEPTDVEEPSLTGEAGKFGCLAVDNVYNVLAKEDPIAYLLNGTIDAEYASSLRTAYVPSTSVSWAKSLSDSLMKGWYGSNNEAAPSSQADQQLQNDHDCESERLPIRLPSSLELEIHDFSREEAAEKKAYLLNDNGQIDWYLRSSGGPLEIQYLNMLSAHTRYWTDSDFIRFVCVEVGRRPGRKDAIPGMKARKKRTRD